MNDAEPSEKTGQLSDSDRINGNRSRIRENELEPEGRMRLLTLLLFVGGVVRYTNQKKKTPRRMSVWRVGRVSCSRSHLRHEVNIDVNIGSFTL